jgi:hypothetical protein
MPLKLNGSTSGYIIVDAPAVAGTNTLTLPAVTDTITTNTATQTLTNKTLSSPTFTGTSSSDISTSGTVVMGSPFTMRNKIINGAMQIWQRGTSGFGPGGYGADRWYLDGVSATSQRSTDVPSTAFQYSNEWGYPGTLSCSIRQRIESVNCFDLAGQTITVSLWAKSTSGTTSLSYSLDYPTATDNFSSLTNIASFVQIGASSLSTSWTYYTFSVAIPAAATTGLQLSFNRNTGGSATTRITGVQLERGTVATPFEYRNYQQELMMCMRYYQQINGPGATDAYFGSGTQWSTTNFTGYLSFMTPMRSSPTFAYNGVSITDGYSFGTAITSVTGYRSTTSGSRIDGTNGAAGAGGRATFFYLVSGYASYSAEL